MRSRLVLGGLVSALALSFTPSASADPCDVECRVIEITKPFFCIKGFSC